MKADDFCDLVLSIDEKIRYVCVYLDERVSYRLQKNVESYFTDDENMVSVKTEVVRASMRRYMVEKLGEPIFSITQYPKVKMITFHFMVTNLILMSTEPDANQDYIVEKTLALVEAHGSSLE
ncbi:MAG: hypothetical protein ACREBB_03780 [Nitrosotalea sp.]